MHPTELAASLVSARGVIVAVGELLLLLPCLVRASVVVVVAWLGVVALHVVVGGGGGAAMSSCIGCDWSDRRSGVLAENLVFMVQQFLMNLSK